MVKRKTREQKIRAELRSLKSQLPPTPNQTSSIKIDLPSISSPVTKASSSYDYSYVSKDLRKIFVLAVVLVLLELGLSLTTQNESVKLILRSIGLNF